MRIALFITCYNDLLYPEVGQAIVRVLRHLGHEVEFPAEQTCCGQMHFNSGYQDACIPLVQRFVDAFAGYDAVVTPSGSCASMVRRYHPLVAGLAADGGVDAGLPERAQARSSFPFDQVLDRRADRGTEQLDEEWFLYRSFQGSTRTLSRNAVRTGERLRSVVDGLRARARVNGHRLSPNVRWSRITADANAGFWM